MEWTGGNLESFEKASEALKRLTGLEIRPKEIEKLCQKFGRERAGGRDADIVKFKAGDLVSQYREPPAVVMVGLDGGRAQVRAPESSPGVHAPHWTEFKAGNLSTYTNVSFRKDPQPEPPAKFLDPPKVRRLVDELRGDVPKNAHQEVKKAPSRESSTRRGPKIVKPEPKVRTVVATTKGSDEFGEMVAAEAQRRGFYEAKKKGAIGDGGLWIWAIVALQFPGFVPILDFLHLMSHLYGASQAAYPKNSNRAWRFYEKILRLSWSGRTKELKRLLRQEAERVGKPPKDPRDDDPRKILWNVVDYVEKNSDKMDYPRYRKEGLPISSASVESLVKQINRRVKGTEKFWIPQGLEAILQIRAAYLSEDGKAEDYWRHRPPDRAYGKNRFRAVA